MRPSQPTRKVPLLTAVAGVALALGAAALTILISGGKGSSPTRPESGQPANFEIALESCPRALALSLGQGCVAVYDTENGRLHAFVRGEKNPVKLAGLSSTGRAEDTNRLADKVLWREDRSPAWTSSPPSVVHRHLGWSENTDGSSLIRHGFTLGDSPQTIAVRETLRPVGRDSWQRHFEVSGLPPQTTLSLSLPPPTGTWHVSSTSAKLAGGSLTFAADGSAVLTRTLAP